MITARGGSKGLPGKNIRQFNGQPLLYWTIQAAKESKYLDRLVITTDCSEIAGIAEQFGCEVPFLRPKELAADTSPSNVAITHALECLNENYDYLTILEPTSPLREGKDIDQSIEIIVDEKMKSVLSVSKVEAHHPQFLFNKSDQNIMSNYLRHDYKSVRRQDISSLYALDGSIYTVRTQDYLQTGEVVFDGATFALQLESWKEYEIDTLDDFIAAEALAKEYTYEN
ncbi:acylneuraminate cytidylyltransferase family protein [Amylibacter sp.]|nr:acylneuraminate cytidylyltransferase family protein [Amylibacter sp.]